jgi:GR25 family glycosyltransferase involved in LPS biosynthesis
MKIYIIHYTKLKERKNNIEKILSGCDDYQFIESFDKGEISESELKYYYEPNKDKFDQKISPLWDSNHHKFRTLNDAEISCTIKHIVALNEASKINDEYSLILEDDIICKDKIINLNIDKIVKNAPPDWDSIFLGSGCGIDFMNQKLKDCLIFNESYAKVKPPSTNCAEAYIIKKESAKKIYESIIPFQLVSDWELAYHFYKLNMNVYWYIPPIFEQGSKNGSYNSTLR